MKLELRIRNYELRLNVIGNLSLVTCILLVAFCSTLFAQKKESYVVLHHADSLVGSVLNGENIRELIGNVRLSKENTVITCDRATEYYSRKYFVLEGNVRIKEDSLLFEGRRGSYWSDSKIMEGMDGVRLQEGKKNLTAEYGKYFAEERRATFQKNVVAIDSDATLKANALTYFRADKHLLATGNVSLTSAHENLKTFGENFENIPARNYSSMSGNPKIVQIDTFENGERDTLIITAKLLEVFRDSGEIFIARDSVVLMRDYLSATANALEYLRSLDSVILRGKPVVWYDVHQISGDSIFLKLANKQLHNAYIEGSAFALSLADSFFQQRYNQLSGERMQLTLRQKKIQHIIVEQHATSLYFLFDEDSSSLRKKPNGVNKASGDAVHISFGQKNIERIVVQGGVEGQYFPENLVERNEEDFRLDGFIQKESPIMQNKNNQSGRKKKEL